MTLAGSGNEGITVSVPISSLGARSGSTTNGVDEALALACLVTSQTTQARHAFRRSAAARTRPASGWRPD